jgi:predicted Zn-dependent peptidase
MSVDVTKLPSGLTVITDTMPHLETAALGVWAGVGGRDEKPNEHGISHLLEHMAFKGTARRSSREIVEEIEAVGGDLNAGTSTETTAYYARVMKADVPLALDVLSDILANPSFVPDELEREKSVIVQEIGAAQDTPDDVVFEHLNELCYPDQPMGRSLLGTAKTLKEFNRDTLRGYLSTHYRGPDMVVAAAGAIDHKRVVEEVSQRFASFEGTAAPKPQPAMFGKGGSRVVHRELEQAHLTLALEGVPQNDPSLFSLQVFTNTLGGGMSSRLFQEVREKRGLCYSIYTFHAPYTDTGFFGLYTGTDPGDAPEMMEVIVDVINDAVETLTEAEIARAKAQMKAGLLMALESCSSRAEQLARHILAYGRPLTVEELVARIDAVSVESTRNAARDLLSRSRPAVVALGSGRGLDTAVLYRGPLRVDRVRESGSIIDGPVSFAIQRTGRPCAARPWPDAARTANVRFPAMGAFARPQPGLPDAVGADLAVRRSDPHRLPAAPAPLCRGYRRRSLLSVPGIPGNRRGDDRRRHAGERPPRHRAGRHHRLLGRAAPCASRLHDGGAAGAAAVAVRRAQPASRRGRLHPDQCAVDPGAGEMRL